MKIDFASCIVTGGNFMRMRVENAMENYAAQSVDYFQMILAKRKDMKFTKEDVVTARGLGIDLEKEASASCEKQETVGATLSDTLKSIFS